MSQEGLIHYIWLFLFIILVIPAEYNGFNINFVISSQMLMKLKLKNELVYNKKRLEFKELKDRDFFKDSYLLKLRMKKS